MYACSRSFSWHSWTQPPKNLDQTTLAQITPAQGPSPEALPHVNRAVQAEDDSLRHSWKSLRPLPSRGEDMPFCSSIKPRPESSRVSGLRAQEFGDLIFLDHGLAKIGHKTFGFLIFLDEATSHLTAYPCKSTSPSEVLAKLHDWMDTFQMNPKAICAEMAFHQPHDMQAFYQMHHVKRVPTGPHTPWRKGVRSSRSFSWHSWTQPPKTWTRQLWHRSLLLS